MFRTELIKCPQGLSWAKGSADYNSFFPFIITNDSKIDRLPDYQHSSFYNGTLTLYYFLSRGPNIGRQKVPDTFFDRNGPKQK